MNHIFHYYVTGFLALRAGFKQDEALTLARSAQMVDHALLPYAIRIPGKTAPYLSPVTHHFGFWDPDQERSIWMPYHFFPSASADSRRRDQAVSPYRVVPDSAPVKELLVAALKTRDLYRVGIALHTYADSWAHQEFTGQRDDFNSLPGVIGIPPLGHAQAERLPDQFQVAWHDSRLAEPAINNRDRFLAAARQIYKYLATYQRRAFTDVELVMTELELLLGPRLPPRAMESMGSRVQTSLKQGLASVRSLAARLSSDSGGQEPAEYELIDRRQPAVIGASDAELEIAFNQATGFEAYDRLVWRKRALVLGPGETERDDEVTGINDKISWLRHELLSRVGYAPKELNARPGFSESPFLHWCEAARAHGQTAASIIAQI